MAKGGMTSKDTFFIRGEVTHTTASGFTQAEIDLGAFVDSLGESVLRIHNVQVQMCDEDEYEKGPVGSTNSQGLNIRYQLTTQSQSDLVLLSDKSVIASGNYYVQFGSGNQIPQLLEDVNDVGPQDFTNGYLVGVDTIYLGCDHDTGETTADGYIVSVCMECSSEKLTKGAGMALALSQQ